MRIALVLAVMATPAMSDILSDAGGLYKWGTAEFGATCTAVDYDNADLEIRGNSISFIETNCKLSNPTMLRDMPEGMLYDAVCSGEGDVWQERMMIYKTYDGIAVISRGAVRPYRRCE
jgi:hypothetical protein